MSINCGLPLFNPYFPTRVTSSPTWTLPLKYWLGWYTCNAPVSSWTNIVWKFDCATTSPLIL